MSHIVHDHLARGDARIVAQPQAAAAVSGHEVDRNFGLPTALYGATVAGYLGFLLVVGTISNPTLAGEIFSSTLAWITQTFGWFYMLAVAILRLALAASRSALILFRLNCAVLALVLAANNCACRTVLPQIARCLRWTRSPDCSSRRAPLLAATSWQLSFALLTVPRWRLCAPASLRWRKPIPRGRVRSRKSHSTLPSFRTWMLRKRRTPRKRHRLPMPSVW